MRRLLVLTLLVLFPTAALAAPAVTRVAQSSTPKAKKRPASKRGASRKPAAKKAPEPEKAPAVAEQPPPPAPEPAPVAPSPTPPSDAPTVATPTLSPEPSTTEPAARLLGEPLRRSTAHRYAFVAGGLAGATGMAFGYWANGETKRAQSIPNAAESKRVLDGAKRTAATATLLYGVAAVSVVYGLVIELLPQKVADKASLTYHF